MKGGFTDHFSGVAAKYADFRPTYPAALFEWLANRTAAHDLAWDCACGSGQASRGLAAHFKHVIATDASEAQIDAAQACPGVEYRVANAESSGLADGTTDLVTVATALHWFDVDRFYAEVWRVSKPAGMLAVWSYGLLVLEDKNINKLVRHFYGHTVGPYWPPERRHVASGYRTLSFPFREIDAPPFTMGASWTLAELLGYFHTWSSVVQFVKARGFDPVAGLEKELAPLWGDPASRKMVKWPLVLRTGQI